MSKTLSRKRRIFVVDDHPIFRRGIAQAVNHEKDIEICGEAENASEALEAAERIEPDLMLIDITLPGTNGIELIKCLRARCPDLRLLVISMHDESLYAERALRAGAQGYVMKQEASEQVMAAIRQVLDGGIYVSPAFSDKMMNRLFAGPNGVTVLASPVQRLSDGELEVFGLVGEGRSTRQIADALHLSVKTIESHREHIKEKLNLKTSLELVRFAVEWVSHQG